MEERIGRDTWAEIDLDAIEHNISQFRKIIPTKTKILCAVKANAYGHGAVPVAKAALEAGADYLAVAFLDEAIELRNSGIEAPILVLGYVPPHALPRAIAERVILTIPDESYFDQIEMVANQLRQRVNCHVKVDTGMSRLGLMPADVPSLIKRVNHSKFVEIEGVFTHFATADERDKGYYEKQYRIFEHLVTQLQSSGFDIPIIHASNSAATIEYPNRSFDMIRLGIGLYGFYPSEEVRKTSVDLKPAMSLHSRVSMVKKVPKGTGISYGKTYITSGDEWIATIPIGYADGILRSLSNRAQVLLHGTRVPIVGRICMDQFMVNVDAVQPVQVGDEVVIYGKQGKEEITVEELARWMNTIQYEVTCMLDRRVPRIYKRKEQVVEIVNHLT